MENAVDALKIAAAILVFIIAIGTSFSVFGTAKQTADAIITMRDKQAYLEAAELDGGILYTSSDAVESGSVVGVISSGERIVYFDDIISTISRYSKEKYGVTIVESDGTVIARYDSNTENIMRQWYNIESGLEDYITKLIENTSTSIKYGSEYTKTPQLNETILKELYRIKVTGNNQIDCGAPWYGNDEEIQKRIIADIDGTAYEYNGQEYEGKNLKSILSGATVVEVINEIDKSKYVEDGEQTTSLLQTYNMPTIEIVYIVVERTTG